MKKMMCVVIALMLTMTMAGTATAQKSLKIAGSTTVLPLAQLWVEAFAQKHPDLNTSLSGGGSGTGLSMLLNGTIDIANASREAKPKEIDAARARNQKLVGTKLAKDGLAVIVHPSNNVKNLTIDQLGMIYNGKASNWKQVGGDSAKGIVVIGRDVSSGTYAFFQDTVLKGSKYKKEMLSLPTNDAVARAVAQSEAAIGYVGLGYARKYADAGKVKILSISRKKGETGMLPTDELVKSGKYPLFRYLYAYTLGAPKGVAAEHLKFALSPEGQALVVKADYLPVK